MTKYITLRAFVPNSFVVVEQDNGQDVAESKKQLRESLLRQITKDPEEFIKVVEHFNDK